MEFYKKMQIGAGAISEGGLLSVTCADGSVSFAEVIMIGAVHGAAATIAYVFLRGNIGIRFHINRDGELGKAPTMQSTRRRARGRRHTVRR